MNVPIFWLSLNHHLKPDFTVEILSKSRNALPLSLLIKSRKINIQAAETKLY